MLLCRRERLVLNHLASKQFHMAGALFAMKNVPRIAATTQPANEKSRRTAAATVNHAKKRPVRALMVSERISQWLIASILPKSGAPRAARHALRSSISGAFIKVLARNKCGTS